MDSFLIFFQKFSSFEDVVVLPEPCRPIIRIVAGGLTFKFKSVVDPPKTFDSSSLNIFINCSAGETLFKTSDPIAFSLIVSINSFTTL